MVDLVGDGGAEDKSLVEQLWEAPQKIAGFLSETSKQYVVHVLELVKSYWPGVNLAPLSDRLAEGCSEEKFAEYIDELKPIADKIIKSLEQPSDEEA